RENHLISAETFVRMSRQDQVVILDARSDEMYTKKHIKGAVHLNFSDFTQIELMRLFPDPETIILIYCNNNFEDDQIYFPTKSFNPRQFRRNARELTLALNIPTYINLYGY